MIRPDESLEAPEFQQWEPQLRAALRPAQRLVFERAEDLPVCATRFGGLPYREVNAWPQCGLCARPMVFLGQFDPRSSLTFEPGFALGALYFCRRCNVRAGAARGGGFDLVTFAAPAPEKHVPFDVSDLELLAMFEREGGFALVRSCKVTTAPFRTMPHLEDWGDWVEELQRELPPRDGSLSLALATEPWRPFWDAYVQWRESLGDVCNEEDGLFSYLGGHPSWVNGVHDHRALGGARCHCGARVEQLLQLDTEEEAGFSFGKGAGLLNLFQCPRFASHAAPTRDGFADDSFRLVQQFI